jgi:hypothetical protein
MRSLPLTKDEWDQIEVEFKEWDEATKFSSSQRQLLDWFKRRIFERQ